METATMWPDATSENGVERMETDGNGAASSAATEGEANREERIVYVHRTACPVCGEEEEIKVEGERWLVERAAESLQARAGLDLCDACRKKQEDMAIRQACSNYLDEAAERAGVPRRFLTWDANLGNNSLLQFFSRNLGRWLYVCDRVDTGKTRAAARAIKMVLRDEPTARVRYWQASSLAAYFAGLAGLDCQRAYEFRLALGSCRLLVLDDLGMKEKYSESFADFLYQVADDIYSRGGALWILSNREIEKLSGCLPARVYDALVSRFGRERNAGHYASWVRGKIDE